MVTHDRRIKITQLSAGHRQKLEYGVRCDFKGKKKLDV